ncbi:MAG: glycosyltransferase [Bacteroidales bacterium]|nr:glycosyltransferase [Bacteroidales bacterium]
MINILVTGDYDPGYNRTKIILDGLLSRSDVQVMEYPFSRNNRFSPERFRSLSDKADVVFLPSFTHSSVLVARRHTNKPIAFDPLISRYLTKVFDYKLVWKYSPRALKNYLKDKRALKASDIIFADTHSHKHYYCKTFNIPPEKVKVLHIGANTSEFKPEGNDKLSGEDFIVGFYGGFIPLQGVKNIVKAAQLLTSYKTVKVELIGNGFEFDAIKKYIESKNIENVCLKGWKPYEELAGFINNWKVCLGVFGATKKAGLVIPNKIYHYAAMGKATITKNTEAISEVFSDGETIVLCSGEPEEIAARILDLYRNNNKRVDIGNRAEKLIRNGYDHHSIARKFLEAVRVL